ncbi:hypothetical protein A8F94_24555 [Bacillus sp. FJAT-27225]|uniref:hypothetical protein n=1 Tax=Bacillus sp. FJAT-27225 TaxID=1743144 RepID=UPI00080C2B20|nr:hypothetical protein [Bacillus sp. FJAT-27225]OCA88434.1 hypothetical protein A8F94_24555 [Bacillus sp. FJAT-27225]
MLSKEVLRSFNVNGEITPLKGGQNTSVRVNNVVLKPVEDVLHSERLFKIISSINPQGYRLSKPIKSNKGTFVSNGWGCTNFERGQEVNGQIKEKLRVSRLFHRDLSNIRYKDFSQVDNPWSKAHRIAWQIDGLRMGANTEARKIINELLQKIQLREQYNLQIVHSDLAGNILFDDVLPPLIIDFSPTVAPVEYAEAILVCDCIAWQGSKISDIDLLPGNKEMFIRAVVFRLAAEAIISGENSSRFNGQYNLFKQIIDYVESDSY